MTSLAHFSIRFIGASLCVALGSSPHLDRSFACRIAGSRIKEAFEPLPHGFRPRFVDSGPALFWGSNFYPWHCHLRLIQSLAFLRA